MKTRIKIAFGVGEDFGSACKMLENMINNLTRELERDGFYIMPDPITTHNLSVRGSELPYHYLLCKIIGVKETCLT